MVLILALGVAVFMVARSTVKAQTVDPLPRHTGLFHVEIDHDAGLDGLLPDAADWQHFFPHQTLSYPETEALMQLGARMAATFVGGVVVRGAGPLPGEELEPPAPSVLARFCSADLFSMFEIDFRHGGPWARGDANADVAVISAVANRAWFGGANSVGKILRIGRREFRIVGVLADELAMRRKTYDWNWHPPEAVFLPFEAFRSLEVRPDFFYSWGTHGPRFEDLIASGDLFIHLWVEPAGDA
jgi:putative ABC transport system permease protein